MSTVENLRKRVEGIRQKIGDRQQGKTMAEMPVIRRIQRNMLARIETRRIMLPIPEQALAPPVPQPPAPAANVPQAQKKEEQPPAQKEPASNIYI